MEEGSLMAMRESFSSLNFLNRKIKSEVREYPDQEKLKFDGT